MIQHVCYVVFHNTVMFDSMTLEEVFFVSVVVGVVGVFYVGIVTFLKCAMILASMRGNFQLQTKAIGIN
jgi:hypothetical protein